MIKTFKLLNKVEKNIKFELTDLLINQVIDLVDNNQNTLLLVKLNKLHHADIAEILEELNVDFKFSEDFFNEFLDISFECE